MATNSGAHVAGCMVASLGTPPPNHRRPSPTPSPDHSIVSGEPPSAQSIPPAQMTPPPGERGLALTTPSPAPKVGASSDTLRMLAQTSKISLLEGQSAETLEYTQTQRLMGSPPPPKGKGVGHSPAEVAAKAPAKVPAHTPAPKAKPPAKASAPLFSQYDHAPSQASQEPKLEGYWRPGEF